MIQKMIVNLDADVSSCETLVDDGILSSLAELPCVRSVRELIV